MLSDKQDNMSCYSTCVCLGIIISRLIFSHYHTGFTYLFSFVMASAKAVYIVGARSSAFCRRGGALRGADAARVYAAVARAALSDAGLEGEDVDATIVGNLHFLSQCDGGKTARYCGLYAGAPVARPALAVSAGAGSGLRALLAAAVEIQTTDAEIVLTGGTELMSTLPLLARGVRFGFPLGSAPGLVDAADIDHDSYTGVPARMWAERAARAAGLTRAEVDGYVLRSLDRFKAAQDSELFRRLLAPVVTVDGAVALGRSGPGAAADDRSHSVVVGRDDVRDVTADGLASMTPIEGGAIVTDGNCASAGDGAAALVLCSAAAAARRGLRPLARVAGGRAAAAGSLGAVAAVRALLGDDARVDLFELNESYAAESLACERVLRLEPARVNTAGGMLASAQPAAAAAARSAATLAHALSIGNLSSAVAAANCGLGQGVAVMLERV